MTSPDLHHLARTAYEAHRDASSGPLPPWDETPEQEQQAWTAAVAAITGQGDVTVTEGPPAQSLVIQAGDETRIFHRDFTVGRQGSLTLRDERASSHHALFQFAHGLWYVQDLDSTNGTWLNGRRIYQSQRLKKSDKVRVGHTTMIVVSA